MYVLLHILYPSLLGEIQTIKPTPSPSPRPGAQSSPIFLFRDHSERSGARTSMQAKSFAEEDSYATLTGMEMKERSVFVRVGRKNMLHFLALLRSLCLFFFIVMLPD